MYWECKGISPDAASERRRWRREREREREGKKMKKQDQRGFYFERAKWPEVGESESER